MQAGLDQFLGLAAVVELGGGHRVAAGDAADHDRAGGAAAAGDRAVDPLVAGGVERLGEFGDSRGLAAGGPPMGDFEVGRAGRRREGQGDRGGQGSRQKLITHVLPPEI